jgi:hypothetical protein
VVLSYAIAVTIAMKRLLPSSIAFVLTVKLHINLKMRFLRTILDKALMLVLPFFTCIL